MSNIIILDALGSQQTVSTLLNGGVNTPIHQDTSDGTVGSASPAIAGLIGGSDGTDLRAVATDSSGQVKVLVENSPTVSIIQGGNTATVQTLTHSNPLCVEIVDGSGNQITTFGGGTQYVTGSTVATPTGTAALGWDGTDVRAISTDSSGQQKVLIENPSVAVTTTADGSATGGTAGSKSFLVGGIYNSSAPTLTNGQQASTQLDSSGNLKVTIVGGSSSNPAASATGSTVPADAGYTGFNSSGNLVGVSSATPFPVTIISGGGSGSNAAAGVTGSPVPSSAGYTAFNSSGNLVGVSSSNPLPVSTGTVTVEVEGHAGGIFDAVIGAAAPANAIQVGGSDGTDLRAIATDSSGQVKVLIENGSAIPVSLSSTTITGSVAVTGTFFQATQPVSGTFWQATQPISGTVTADIKGNSGASIDAAPGSAIPTNGILVGGSDGTDLRAIATDTSGQVKVLIENNPGVTIAPSTSGGLSTVSAGSLTNSAVSVKSSAGQLYGYFLDNTENTSTTYFQIFNTASGSVTVGTTSPLFSIAVPGGLGANLSFAIGVVFSTAISIAATTTRSGGTAPSSSVSFTIWYD